MTFLAHSRSFLIKNLTNPQQLPLYFVNELLIWNNALANIVREDWPTKVMLFYCIQSEHANLHVGWHERCSFSLSSVSRSLPVMNSVLKLNILSLQSLSTHLHIHCSLSHMHTFPPLVSLAHIFHLILPVLCLFLTSLYSQLSIGTIPANYPQCHSHYFPISAANLLNPIAHHPTPAPPHPQTHQLPDSF